MNKLAITLPAIPGQVSSKSQNSDENHFTPPHCVNPECPNFTRPKDGSTFWFKRFGTYDTAAFGTVQRYLCKKCGKSFSTQSFSLDYYVKLPLDYRELLIPLLSSSGQGNITRFSGVRYERIQNRFERMARCFMAIHATLREYTSPKEDFVLDGFESFSYSQYFPNNINILVGADTEYLYTMGFAQLRRKGRMTQKQKEMREQLESVYGRADPKAIELSVKSILTDACNFIKDKNLPDRELRTDEHKAYVRAIKKIPEFARHFDHRQYSSKAARTPLNALFGANYADRQFRKDQANQTRETVQFARCPAAMMVRLSLYQFHHNYLMPRRVKEQRKGNWQTRGEYQGIETGIVLSVIKEMWGKRVFFNKTKLWKEEVKSWGMFWRNSKIENNRYVPKYIAA